MNLRVFAIAKELGIDSKQFLWFCQMAGVQVKNFELAVLTKRQRDRVLVFIEQHQRAIRCAERVVSQLIDQRPSAEPDQPPTRRQQLYSGLCEKSHRKMLAGTCPWCGQPIVHRS